MILVGDFDEIQETAVTNGGARFDCTFVESFVVLGQFLA
jgi:hypothetical protein